MDISCQEKSTTNIWKSETNNKTLLTTLLLMERQQKKYNIQGDMRTLLGKDCEVEKIIRFLKRIGMFVEI